MVWVDWGVELLNNSVKDRSSIKENKPSGTFLPPQVAVKGRSNVATEDLESMGLNRAKFDQQHKNSS